MVWGPWKSQGKPSTRPVTLKGYWHADNSKSSDLNFMRSTDGAYATTLGGIQRDCRNRILLTYLSKRPPVAPRLIGRLTKWCCKRQSAPTSQGVRSDRSSRMEMSEKILKLRIGRFQLSAVALVVDAGSSSLLYVLAGAAPREYAAKRPTLTKRKARKVK